MATKRSPVHVRWMIRRDMRDVLQIEHDSFPFPWQEEDFLTALRERNTIGMVAEIGETVVGYMVYTAERTKILLVNMAVDPDYRRRGIGRTMIGRLFTKIEGGGRRNRISVDLRESNLPGQLFLRDMDFRAVRVERNAWDNGEAAYVMVWHRPGGEKAEREFDEGVAG